MSVQQGKQLAVAHALVPLVVILVVDHSVRDPQVLVSAVSVSHFLAGVAVQLDERCVARIFQSGQVLSVGDEVSVSVSDELVVHEVLELNALVDDSHSQCAHVVLLDAPCGRVRHHPAFRFCLVNTL